MVTKHFQELQQRELRAEREDVLKMKRIAGTVAKMIREFWSNIEKVSHASNSLTVGPKKSIIGKIKAYITYVSWHRDTGCQ